jgi:hypothetical protein
MIMLVNTGVNGIVTKGLRKKLEDVAGKYSVGPLQNTATLGTSPVIGKAL